jgi:hypothetical protein
MIFIISLLMGHRLRISNKYGSVTTLKQLPNQTTMSEKAGLQIKCSIIDQKCFLKSDINLIRQFRRISKRQFEISEAMRILNIRNVISKAIGCSR